MINSNIQKQILQGLLTKYESSKTYKGENLVQRSFSIKPTDIFKEYDKDSTDINAIEDFEKECNLLESEKLIQLDWKYERIIRINAIATTENWKKIRTILGVKDKIVLKLTKGQFILDGKVFYYDTKNEYVKKAKENINRCMTGKKIVTVRAEHVNSLLKSDIDINNLIAELPKFHFTISNKGIKCDEVNYAKMALDNYFIMNDGGEVMCENRVYYDYYCKYGDLPFFSLEDYYTYDEFISELSHLNTKLNRESRMNFEFSEWQTAIITGINRLFKSMRTYEREGRLDLVPVTFAGDVISFRHKIYKSIDKKSDVQRDYILKMVEKQRMDAANGGKLPYWISYPKDEMGIIQINDDSYIIVETLKNYNIH
jgi:hypothetical protein